jgi:uncharacterized protein (DUF1800 family)
MSRIFTRRGAALAFGARAPGWQALGATLLLSLLAACGGGGGGGSNPGNATEPPASTGNTSAAAGDTAQGSGGTTSGAGDTGAGAGSTTGPSTAPGGGDAGPPSVPDAPTTHADAFRMLTQATFGPTDADVAQAMKLGAAGWIDAQLALPSSSAYVTRWDADTQALAATNPGAVAGPPAIASQFYKQALKSPDQLRGRVAFALSQIFVVSTQELIGNKSRGAASYFDMLNRDAFGNYRTLLQDVAMHPAMGLYLTSLKNMKENPATGQIPDQNFAREIMQLMSIGLVQLDADGTPRLGTDGAPIYTYGGDDIVGLSKVFTGFSWYGPDTSTARFMGSASAMDPDHLIQPMQAYPQFHSTSEKDFLGVKIAPQATPDPAASLKTALDTLAAHSNVGPFIGRQLIQRLVTSHPSPAYVARVAQVFADNGLGVRGDLKAVVRAILLDPEARGTTAAAGDTYGKVREPVLRLTAWMRAFNARSDSGQVLVTGTDDPGLELGQTPLRAASVFNFWRPGYIAAGTATGALGLTMPELQATTETSVAGYVNFMSSAVAKGAGLRGTSAAGKRPDVQPDYAGELAVADTSATLVDDVALKLVGDDAPAALKTQVRTAVDAIAIPALKADGSNQAQVAAARGNRVYAAVLLTLAAPEFIVQK